MNHKALAVKLLAVSGFTGWAAVAMPAQAAPSFADCAKQIERRGYVIDDMDTEVSGYDIDASKGGRMWDLRVDKTCKILKERLD